MNQDSGVIPGLPSTYPLDPSLVDEINTHSSQLHLEALQHQQHQVGLDGDVSVHEDYYATDDAGDMSLGDASGLRGLTSSQQRELDQEVEESMPIQKSRKRKLQLACHFCRRRKLKCDGVHPTCANCLKRNETCDWDEAVRRRGPGKRTKALRGRAHDEASGSGMHDASVMDHKHGLMDASGYSLDSASSVADTNAALIAAVTAAAAEGAGSMEDTYETGDISVSGNGGEYEHHHHEGEELDVGEIEGLEPTEEEVAALEQEHIEGQASPSDIIDPLDPNIDPSLSDLGPETLADTGDSPTGIPIGVAQLQQQQSIDQIRTQRLQAALQIQRQHHLHQQQLQQQHQQQQQRKLAGVGVGVGSSVQIQAPSFGGIQTPTFGVMSAQSSSQPENGLGEDLGEVEGGDVTAADALDWDKGYNFSTWPDLDLGATTG